MIHDQLSVNVAVRYEEIHADVHHEINVDDALEDEHDSWVVSLYKLRLDEEAGQFSACLPL